MQDQINRLGFQAWADNLIVNALENLDGKFADFQVDRGDASIVGRVLGDKMTIAVRAYITGRGWEMTEQTLKLPNIK